VGIGNGQLKPRWAEVEPLNGQNEFGTDKYRQMGGGQEMATKRKKGGREKKGKSLATKN